jgi:hypothetical protein
MRFITAGAAGAAADDDEDLSLWLSFDLRFSGYVPSFWPSHLSSNGPGSKRMGILGSQSKDQQVCISLHKKHAAHYHRTGKN